MKILLYIFIGIFFAACNNSKMLLSAALPLDKETKRVTLERSYVIICRKLIFDEASINFNGHSITVYAKNIKFTGSTELVFSEQIEKLTLNTKKFRRGGSNFVISTTGVNPLNHNDKIAIIKGFQIR